MRKRRTVRNGEQRASRASDATARQVHACVSQSGTRLVSSMATRARQYALQTESIGRTVAPGHISHGSLMKCVFASFACEARVCRVTESFHHRLCQANDTRHASSRGLLFNLLVRHHVVVHRYGTHWLSALHLLALPIHNGPYNLDHAVPNDESRYFV